RSGRRIDKDEKSNRKTHYWRTRKDPFEAVWASELEPLLTKEPELTGITLWDHLDEKYPGQYPEKLLRTLQRRVKHWLATRGPDKEVMFRQSVPAGHQGLSDFTRPNTAITLAGEPFEHLLYQFRLAHSGWRHVHIVQGGESYSALADGLQNALHTLGGAPREHRTDSLSAAYVNNVEKQYLTDNYEALCQHYGMTPTTNNLGVSHENGAIEAPHGSLKRRIAQAVKLRGSTDFATLRAYREFVERIVNKLNKRCKGRLSDEQKSLQALPTNRFIDYIELTAKVTTSSTISVKRGLYTVPSRLIGEAIQVHLYHDRLACFVGQTLVITLPRAYPTHPAGRARCINYHHIIHSLAAKPQAFRFSQFREDILPSGDYRQLWAMAEQQFAPKDACKWIVAVLRFSYDYDCESLLAAELLQEARHRTLPDLKTLQARYLQNTPPPSIPVRQHAIDDYDQLLSGQWKTQEVAYG
ncbi:MAG: IS21 family transposase, partial [Gammaproteobacteria bacterium]|nr:IS21 family transposase [Gammaproteobacteria bacterium]